MAHEHAGYIIVGNVNDEDQEKDKADLDKTLLEGEAEIAPANAFEKKKKNLAAIQNGDGKKVENAEINTDESHETDDRVRALGDGLPSGARDPYDTLKLFHGDASAEKLADDIDGLRDERNRLEPGGLE